MFENALKNGFRYPSIKGLVTTEDLFSLKLTDLDTIAKTINKEIKDSEEESFISVIESNTSKNVLKLEIVKRVIAIKLEAKEKAEKAKTIQSEKAKLLELIAQKKDESLTGLSIEELENKLKNLD